MAKASVIGGSYSDCLDRYKRWFLLLLLKGLLFPEDK